MTHKQKHILKWFARRFGLCVHPAEAIEVFHFSRPDGRGGYLKGLTCGYLCGICLGKVDVPVCERHPGYYLTGKIILDDQLSGKLAELISGIDTK